jgi:hypothetical protein
MNRTARQYGFSLTETLMAVGTLAIGLVFIAGTFMTGLYFSSLSTERTIAAVVAEEGFAKVQLYGLLPEIMDPNQMYGAAGGAPRSVPYERFVTTIPTLVRTSDPNEEFWYPSTRPTGAKQYAWAALCRRLGGGLVQCTVFVSRQTGGRATLYWMRQPGPNWPRLMTPDPPLARPHLVPLVVGAVTRLGDEISLRDHLPGDNIDELTFVNDGSVLVDDETGHVYRVRERLPSAAGSPSSRIKLDQPWVRGAGGWVWVVPPPASAHVPPDGVPAASAGRNPVVGVYQKVLRFPGG